MLKPTSPEVLLQWLPSSIFVVVYMRIWTGSSVKSKSSDWIQVATAGKGKLKTMKPCLTPVFTWNLSINYRPCIWWWRCSHVSHIVEVGYTLSDAFPKSGKCICSNEFHSNDCPTAIHSVTIWSTHGLSLRNPACWSRKCVSTKPLVRLNNTVLKTFPIIDSNVLSPQFSH